MFDYNKFEKGLNQFENRGTVLEEECFASVKKASYDTSAIAALHPEEFSADRAASDEEMEYFRRKNLIDKYHEELYKKDTYIPYDQAMELVRKSQPFNPENPSPSFAKMLHANIKQFLSLGEHISLKFYTAVGSHLDRHHGIDAFFEISDAEGAIAARTTMDIKKYNPEKSIKADQLIVMTDDEKALYDQDPKAYEKRGLVEAEAIARKLLADAQKRKEIKNYN